MIEWTEEQQMIRDEMRKFVEAEIVPNIEELEHGDTPPYEVLRKMFRTFGMDEMARERFQYQLAKKKARERGEEPPASMRTQMELYDELKITVGTEAQNEIMTEILNIAQEQFWVMGKRMLSSKS